MATAPSGKNLIAVIGATGQQGGAVVRALQAAVASFQVTSTIATMGS